MNIIKQGLTEEELKGETGITFKCPHYECIFEAFKDEYCEFYIQGVTQYTCKCPNCNTLVNKIELDECMNILEGRMTLL